MSRYSPPYPLNTFPTPTPLADPLHHSLRERRRGTRRPCRWPRLNRPPTLAMVARSLRRRKGMRAVSRRAALALGLGTAAAWAGRRGARATPSEADAEIAKFTGGKSAAEGRIAIDLPEIAENGTAVPLGVTVESPMTAADRITDILVVADGNPNPRVGAFSFTPLSARAEVSTRIRLN